MSKVNPKLRTVKLPSQMIKTCQEIIDKHPEYGWVSIASFVRDAITHYEFFKKYVQAK